MNKTCHINILLETTLKEEAQHICTRLGINLSTAVRMFLTQLVEQKALHLELKTKDNGESIKKNEAPVVTSKNREKYPDATDFIKSLSKR